MEVIQGAAAFRLACDRVRSRGERVGFVPTMGSFHQGHRSLMRLARAERDAVAVSIFVNPLQFGPTEDLAGYPRDPVGDEHAAEEEGVDLLFTPDEGEMWPGGQPTVTLDPGPLGDRLEGASRPGHFRGVLTVLALLFNLAGPCRAYFGEKDAQQLAAIRRMVDDLAFPVEVVGCPTVREGDGLAMSSRNVYLTSEERAAATCLYQALQAAARAAAEGERNAHVLAATMARTIGAQPLARLDYVAVVDDRTFEQTDELGGPARGLVAARFGRARLIDNLLLSSGE
jgi:pantoate--beta-alanine ligase